MYAIRRTEPDRIGGGPSPRRSPVIEDSETIAREAEEDPTGRRMRIFIAVRTRFAEDALAAAVERSVSQLVILGAGLDTYAWRGAMRQRVRVFEVDHPATQAWKRRRLVEAAIPLPDCLTFVPIDFERETLAGRLMTPASIGCTKPSSRGLESCLI
jgi:methyltransferase (TIGR00027 family)